MIDEYDDRDYQAAREALNADVGRVLSRALGAARHAFVVLNRIEYSAPWQRPNRIVRPR